MLQITTNIDVDFYDKKYILINAKQYDINSRFISVTCYNRGELYRLNSGEHAAYIRYRKADGFGVFNECGIDTKGKIVIELTEQMLAVSGVCYADLVIVIKGKANVDAYTGTITSIDEGAILSSMPIHVDVLGTSIENSEIESSDEYSAFNQTLIDYWADYEEILSTAQSWAVGMTGKRENEDTDNAMYYCGQSSYSAAESIKSATNAATSEKNASDSAGAAATSAQSASDSADAVAKSEANVLGYKEIVENINDSIVGSINTLASNGNIGSFIFVGETTFEELISLSEDKRATGYVYCVVNDFVTNDSFVNGAGLSYTAGTNVYHVVDENGVGKWNCLGGSASPTATVDEVKEYLGIIDEIEIV